jgi:hypothetical protein
MPVDVRPQQKLAVPMICFYYNLKRWMNRNGRCAESSLPGHFR